MALAPPPAINGTGLLNVTEALNSNLQGVYTRWVAGPVSGMGKICIVIAHRACYVLEALLVQLIEPSNLTATRRAQTRDVCCLLYAHHAVA